LTEGIGHVYQFKHGKNVQKRIPNYEAILNKFRKDALREIDSEARRLSKVTAQVPNPKGRELGKFDWTDLPQNMPIQKLALDKLGLVLRPNSPYICPKCGTRYLGLPPDACNVCRKPTFFQSLRLRR